jgi:hypothetical protein
MINICSCGLKHCVFKQYGPHCKCSSSGTPHTNLLTVKGHFRRLSRINSAPVALYIALNTDTPPEMEPNWAMQGSRFSLHHDPGESASTVTATPTKSNWKWPEPHMTYTLARSKHTIKQQIKLSTHQKTRHLTIKNKLTTTNRQSTQDSVQLAIWNEKDKTIFTIPFPEHSKCW